MIDQQRLFDEPTASAAVEGSVEERIEAFARFEHHQWPYSKRNWGNGLHSLCSYQSKLKPAIAHFLVRAMTNEGEHILDPFSGVGTIPLEACLQGRVGHGVDINPLAYANTLAKVDFPDLADVTTFMQRLGDYIASDLVSRGELAEVQLKNINGTLRDFYHERTFAEIVTARKFFAALEAHTPASALVLACLLHILHGNRPYALSRRSHGITPFAPSGPFEYRPLMKHLKDKVDRSLKAEPREEYARGAAYFCSIFDFTTEHRYDAIITSPPFLKSTRFYVANWLRLWFCGWEDDDFRATERTDYLEEMQAKSMSIYERVFAKFAALLRPRGVCVLHLGVVGKRDMGR